MPGIFLVVLSSVLCGVVHSLLASHTVKELAGLETKARSNVNV